MTLRLALSTCPNGEGLWELSEIEDRMRDKSDSLVRTLNLSKLAAYKLSDLCPQEHCGANNDDDQAGKPNL